MHKIVDPAVANQIELTISEAVFSQNRHINWNRSAFESAVGVTIFEFDKFEVDKNLRNQKTPYYEIGLREHGDLNVKVLRQDMPTDEYVSMIEALIVITNNSRKINHMSSLD